MRIDQHAQAFIGLVSTSISERVNLVWARAFSSSMTICTAHHRKPRCIEMLQCVISADRGRMLSFRILPIPDDLRRGIRLYGR